MGVGDNINRNTPTILILEANIGNISSGFFHSLILTNSGNLYSFGYNNVKLLFKIRMGN